jgi:Fe-S-cluster-containing hydrogenase component 2
MIEVDLSRCTGCRRCETACAFLRTGRVSNRLARIRVLNLYELGIDGPVVCRQCEERYCVTACPVDALSVGALGQVEVDMELCIQCGACERSCPVGAIELFEDVVYVCDLCDGQPQCVEACTEGAIVYVAESRGPSLAALHERKVDNLSQRRRDYLESLGLELRKEWGKAHA